MEGEAREVKEVLLGFYIRTRNSNPASLLPEGAFAALRHSGLDSTSFTPLMLHLKSSSGSSWPVPGQADGVFMPCPVHEGQALAKKHILITLTLNK